MPRQGFHVTHMVNKCILHMPADVGAGVRHDRYTTAAHRFGAYESEAFLDAWKRQYVTIAHQFRHVVAMAQNAHAGVRKQGCKLLSIVRQKLPGDGECACQMRGRLEPGL